MVLDSARLEKFEELSGGDKEAMERVKSLLTASDKVSKVIDIEGFQLRISPMIPKAVRNDMLRLSKMDKDPTITEEEKIKAAEESGYKLIASICLDSPLNLEETWRELDNQKGLIYYILDLVTAEISKTGEDIRRFR